MADREQFEYEAAARRLLPTGAGFNTPWAGVYPRAEIRKALTAKRTDITDWMAAFRGAWHYLHPDGYYDGVATVEVGVLFSGTTGRPVAWVVHFPRDSATRRVLRLVPDLDGVVSEAVTAAFKPTKLPKLTMRGQVEAVFALGGGELEDTTLTWVVPLDDKAPRPVYRDGTWDIAPGAAHRLRVYNNRWWYDGVPDYAERESARAPAPECATCPPGEGCYGYWEYRTLIREELWGRLEDTDLPPGWSVWARYTTSGEATHPDYAYAEQEGATYAEDDPERHIYLGEGWAEVVIRYARTCANEYAASGFEKKPHGPEDE